jgi:SNF2 family DNA or RNA helicase
VKPFPFQLEDLKRIEEEFNGRALAAWDMGLGKTVLTLWYLKRNPQALPAVVVCPASIKYQWQAEAKRIIKMESHVIEGRKPYVLPKVPLYIINYDILKDWVGILKKQKPKMVVLDEIQMTANQTQRTKACQSLCRCVSFVLGLSGTPMLNRPMELYNGLRMIKPTLFNSRYVFGHRYCGPRLTPWGWKFEGISHKKELHQKLKKHLMVRRRKEDVLDDIPPKVRRVITLPLKDEAEYKKAEDDFLGWLEGIDPQKAKRAEKAEMMVRTGYLLRLTARLKIQAAVDWIDQFLEDSREKLVVFCVHRKAIRIIQKRSAYRSAVIHGGITGAKRQDAVRQFQGKGTRLLIGNVQAAGVGLDGLQVASNAAFFEMPWQPGAALQAEARVHRIGSKNKVWCWYMVARNTIETKLCKTLQIKQENLEAVMDGEKASGDFNVFNQLMKQMRGGLVKQ